MKRIMLIDDDRHEAMFWRHVVQSSYRDRISLEWFFDVDEALEALDGFQPDAIILDNKVPPHETASYGLGELKKRSYDGSVFVWSFTDPDTLRDFLADWPEVETLAKQDYVGVKVRELIESHLL